MLKELIFFRLVVLQVAEATLPLDKWHHEQGHSECKNIRRCKQFVEPVPSGEQRNHDPLSGNLGNSDSHKPF